MLERLLRNLPKQSFVIVLVIIGGVMVGTSQAQAGCVGNACADLFISSRNNCIVLTNRNARMNITTDPRGDAAPHPVYVVISNSELIPTIFGQCHRNWYTDYNANYS